MEGNLPLITSDTLRDLVSSCQNGGYDAVVLSALCDKPQGYGRIIRDISGNFEGILEDVEASSEESLIKEINTSVYCFKVSALLKGMDRMADRDPEDRYHIPDLLYDLMGSGQ